MPHSAKGHFNRGAYSSPFSGVGREFFSLGIAPGYSGVVLHESGYLQRNGHWNFPNTFSPFWRLYYDFMPGHQLALQDKTVRLGPDRLVLVPSYIRFHCQGHRAVPSFWLHFNCARRSAPAQVIPIELPLTQTETSLISDLVRVFKARDDEKLNQQVFGFSLALLLVVLNRPEMAWAGKTPKGITRAINHVEENFASELYNEDLSRVAGVSVRSLTRMFRQHHGMSAAQFIAQVRVRKAAHLLLTTDAALEEVAEKTGFPDRAYFTRVFTRLTHEPPAEFRRKYRA